jgi:hypothetical protein
MELGAEMTDFLIDSLSTIILVVLGGYILFAGRRQIWATSGVVWLTVTARLLAILVAEFDTARELIEYREWEMLGLAVLVGLVGIVLGRLKPNLAALLIGVAAGADLALFLYDIAAYLIVDLAQLSESLVTWVTLVVIIVGSLSGLWLVRKSRDEAIILITMLIGVQFIQEVLSFDKSSSWTAIVILSLGLAGMLVQYSYYLRELKASSEQVEPTAHAASMAYFQNLQLEE